jgi:hypothetical protein
MIKITISDNEDFFWKPFGGALPPQNRTRPAWRRPTLRVKAKIPLDKCAAPAAALPGTVQRAAGSTRLTPLRSSGKGI